MVHTKKYLLLDAARSGIEAIEAAMEFFPDGKEMHDSLFLFAPGSEHLRIVAPYIFDYDGSQLEEWYYKNGWGNAWGLYVKTALDFNTIRYHFRKFLKVKKQNHKQMYFRFYDPRVLRIFLPTCDSKQLKEFFGSIEYFVCEDEDPNYGLIFSYVKNALVVEKKTKEELFLHLSV